MRCSCSLPCCPAKLHCHCQSMQPLSTMLAQPPSLSPQLWMAQQIGLMFAALLLCKTALSLPIHTTAIANAITTAVAVTLIMDGPAGWPAKLHCQCRSTHPLSPMPSRPLLLSPQLRMTQRVGLRLCIRLHHAKSSIGRLATPEQ